MTSQQLDLTARPLTPDQSGQIWQSVPGTGGRDLFLAIDVLRVGYMLADGEWKISSAYPKVANLRGKQDPGNKRIGTKTLTICYTVMLISKRGTLMVHLNPQTCDWFLDPKRTNEQKKADKADPRYKASKDMYNNFKKDSQRYLDKFLSRGSSDFRVVIVLGPNQARKDRGEWILQTLFDIQPDRVTQYITMNDIGDQYGSITDRLVVVDYAAQAPVATIGGQVIGL